MRMQRRRRFDHFRTLAQRETTFAVDGVVIRMRRYATPGGQPAILLHGLSQNLNGWDLPVRDRSLAKQLYRAGFDVWLVNFRNHGHGDDRSGTTHVNASIDDLAIWDLPAVVEHVHSRTGLQPFVIGHSMGGIVSLLYLMGIKRCPHMRGTLDGKLSKARNAAVKGVCVVGTPLPLKWKQPNLRDRLPELEEVQQLLYKRVLGSPLTLWVCSRLRTLPVASAFAAPGSLSKRAVPIAGPLVVNSIRNMFATLGILPLADPIWASDNMDIGTVSAEIKHTLNDAPAAILYQLCDWIRAGTMREFTHLGQVTDPLDYMPELGRITAPLLMLAGDRDTAACAEVMYEEGFCNIASQDKRFVLLQKFGHNDLRIGPEASRRIYPLITSWMSHQVGIQTSMTG